MLNPMAKTMATTKAMATAQKAGSKTGLGTKNPRLVKKKMPSLSVPAAFGVGREVTIMPWISRMCSSTGTLRVNSMKQ